MRICVIGAGVVGCATAFELQRAGHEVTLVDAGSGPGLGASFANGAQLSYSYVEPLANPSTLLSLPKLLFEKHSPVRFKLRLDPAQWAWGVRFLAACRKSRSEQGARQLLQLAALSRDVLEEWIAQVPLEFGLQRNGKLVLCRMSDSFSHQARLVEQQAHIGSPQHLLDRDACIRLEPRLASYKDFIGGIWTASECVGDPYAYCVSLANAFQLCGGTVQFNTRVHRFAIAGGSAHAAITGDGEVLADAFVLAGGLASRDLARQLGERLAIYPIKGYSVTLRFRSDADPLPVVSVTDLSRRMVLAPLGGRLRVAAMAEIGHQDLSVPPERLDAILASVQEIYPDLCDLSDASPWAGLRPATPSSVPTIRQSRTRNVVLNVGHGALGFTLAAGSARRVRELLEQRAEVADSPVIDQCVRRVVVRGDIA